MFGKLRKELESNKHYESLNFRIPKDPQKFYEDFGLLRHPETNKPCPKLTAYQYEIWKDSFCRKYRLTIKSQKVGLTTSSLMEDFQKAVLPTSNPFSCRGKEILIIAQSLQHAKEHLYTLRKMIKSSKKYSSFLIDKPDGMLSKDEVTKVMQLFIRNPEDPVKPTRIIGLGANEGASWSWKEVKHIHMSDVAATDTKDDSGLFNAAFSRLANTDGTMHIESPPRGQRGQLWEIYKASKMKINEDDPRFEEREQAKFHVREVPAYVAVEAGLITQDFLNHQRERLGIRYGQYYECEFLNPYNTWYDDSLFKYDDSLQLGSTR